jgi:hypothetical protein
MNNELNSPEEILEGKFGDQDLQELTLEEMMETDFPEPKWIVDELIPHPGITVLSGRPSSYKTWLTQSLAISVASGNKFLGEFEIDNSGGVMFIDKENYVGRIKDRYVSLDGTNENIVYLEGGNIKIDDVDGLNGVMNSIKKHEPKLLILDSLSRMHSKEENSASEMSEVAGALQNIRDMGVSVLYTHHHRKGQNKHGRSFDKVRGSSDIVAGVDCVLSVNCFKKENMLSIEQSKMRYAEELSPFDVDIHSSNEGVTGFEYVGETNSSKSKAEEVASKLPEALKDITDDGQVAKTAEIIDYFSKDYGNKSIREGLKIASADDNNAVEKVPKDDKPTDREGRSEYYRVIRNQE